MQRITFSASPPPAGLLGALLRLGLAAAAGVLALATAALLVSLALVLGAVGLARRAWFALMGRTPTPWLGPLLLWLVQRTRWGRFVPAAAGASPGAPATRQPASDDVTDVAVKAWRK